MVQYIFVILLDANCFASGSPHTKRSCLQWLFNLSNATPMESYETYFIMLLSLLFLQLAAYFGWQLTRLIVVATEYCSFLIGTAEGAVMALECIVACRSFCIIADYESSVDWNAIGGGQELMWVNVKTLDFQGTRM